MVNLPVKSRNQTTDSGAFLKAHVLGLISQVNDMLQDVQGKKGVTVKRRIIRGLGVLILQIGPTITSVAPQVGIILTGISFHF